MSDLQSYLADLQSLLAELDQLTREATERYKRTIILCWVSVIVSLSALLVTIVIA